MSDPIEQIADCTQVQRWCILPHWENTHLRFAAALLWIFFTNVNLIISIHIISRLLDRAGADQPSNPPNGGTKMKGSQAGVPDLGCRHPLGVSHANPWRCQTRLQEVIQKFEIWCPATFVADSNFDKLRWECQRSTRIDGGVSGQNKVGNLI